MREMAKSHSSSTGKFNPLLTALLASLSCFSQIENDRFGCFYTKREKKRDGDHLEIHLLAEHKYESWLEWLGDGPVHLPSLMVGGDENAHGMGSKPSAKRRHVAIASSCEICIPRAAKAKDVADSSKSLDNITPSSVSSKSA
jgi:hypothetical protein